MKHGLFQSILLLANKLFLLNYPEAVLFYKQSIHLKKKMEILLSEDFFPEIMPASKTHSQPFKSHMNSLPENSTFTHLQLPVHFLEFIQLIDTGRLHQEQQLFS